MLSCSVYVLQHVGDVDNVHFVPLFIRSVKSRYADKYLFEYISTQEDILSSCLDVDPSIKFKVQERLATDCTGRAILFLENPMHYGYFLGGIQFDG